VIAETSPSNDAEPVTRNGSCRLRWIGLALLVTAAVATAFLLNMSLRMPQVPWLLATAGTGGVAALLLLLGTRGSRAWLRVVLIVAGLGGFALAGWNVFIAFMVATFPKC